MALQTLEECLGEGEYWGRIILVGRISEEIFVAYAVTGRSPSSKARILEKDERGYIITKPTDEKLLEQGDIDLLIYPAIIPFEDKNRIAVSNGYQTYHIAEEISEHIPKGTFMPEVDILKNAFKQHEITYEPDKPNFTPRISGCVGPDAAGLHIVRKSVDREDKVERFFDTLLIESGKGYFLATYTGENKDPLPSWWGPPREVRITTRYIDTIAEELWDALAPASGKPDFRVGVAVAMFNPISRRFDYEIINRHTA